LDVAGRKQLLTQPMQTNSFGKSITVFIFIYTIICFKTHTVDVIGRVTLSNKLTIIFASWSNVAFMLVLVSGFILLYQKDLLIKY
jgi:uncharacterized protein